MGIPLLAGLHLASNCIFLVFFLIFLLLFFSHIFGFFSEKDLVLAAILDPDLVPGEPNLLVGEHD